MPTATEQVFIDKMTAEGWEVHHNGYPDFLCLKDGQAILVEVKASKNDKVKDNQFEMITLLCSHKLNGFVWSPDKGVLIPIEELRSKTQKTPEPSSAVKPLMVRPKYDTNTKRERNTEIVFLHKLQPELSLDEIGKQYQITGQRVSAIIKRANLKLKVG